MAEYYIIEKAVHDGFIVRSPNHMGISNPILFAGTLEGALCFVREAYEQGLPRR